MFASGPNYNKLKTNLRLACNRLKLLEKKKTETNQKARKEIADFISIGKPDRARIRVESIIREDYLVEAMEILEMLCDLLLARFGLITQLKELDEGISEAISSIIWIAPRLADVAELKVISDILQVKYGKPFADSCRAAVHPANVSEKLQHKMSIQAPPKLLVEKYLIEIAKIYNIEYEPDQSIMSSTIENRPEGFLIDLNEKNNLNGGFPNLPPAPGFAGYPQPPPLPNMPNSSQAGFNFQPQPMYPIQPSYPGPQNMQNMNFDNPPSAPYNYNIMPNNPSTSQQETKDLNVDFIGSEVKAYKNNSVPPPPPYSSISPDDNIQDTMKPKPQPRSKLPDLPNVPANLPDLPEEDTKEDDEIDFDDLSKRFEELKKRH